MYDYDDLDNIACYRLISDVLLGCFRWYFFDGNFKQVNKDFASNGKLIDMWCDISGYDSEKIKKRIIKYNS